MFNIVLVEPVIPPNTGNIARTCAITGSKLHLVKPLGFSISDKHLKRAGLDYWSSVDVTVHESLEEFLVYMGDADFYLATTKSTNLYTDFKYKPNDYILFGCETKGLPEPLLHKHAERCITLPMKGNLRSLNLSNAAAIVVYEAWRQNGFE
ncbi:tRNA (uridine(34)/cytosine(34)/5-carboxymethylaminomethyluridine(34)-2'-O)-methyltransferase TrmL [Clostridium sp. 'deep sea']|uniref:tRNA (uridine(34)/cytosine(34)/5- carboxymethylaminomethyluridine(34)-2'-O)- methyltransferase TrmL n=1 Tax=Clostridium sp. 'deep sea' TaxID=2779445 RepID=UPI0018967C0F|nr:tRNA (uridine(34)/cytosine(34)/5-carboxymethylaminomethyluridine(34)-2'-O)-methyltransferase TrmL [Clostridium sp. 'deep sea']QOR35759.1 tRNA (uridine(34)/cytosine(34)/5-carboxymethylaminomethyluridine(34)-2'-O)-methyltransferase TrmL [Clostridium sp. 'deep sea']